MFQQNRSMWLGLVDRWCSMSLEEVDRGSRCTRQLQGRHNLGPRCESAFMERGIQIFSRNVNPVSGHIYADGLHHGDPLEVHLGSGQNLHYPCIPEFQPRLHSGHLPGQQLCCGHDKLMIRYTSWHCKLKNEWASSSSRPFLDPYWTSGKSPLQLG